MKLFFCGLFLAGFLSPLISPGQKGFQIGPAPQWVAAQQFSTDVPDTADVSGYYYLLSDYQDNAEEETSYIHQAIKVINDGGLSYVSSWDWSYDPSYERMTFHSLYVLRGKRKIDHLARNNFELIQREENFSRASYDGSLSVIVNLKDVKAGDIVVFSYSTKGKNPVFKNHYFRTFQFGFGSSMAKISCRLIVDPKRKLQFKDFGKVPTPNETTKGSLKVYSWEALNVPAGEYEDMLPSWYSNRNRVQVSDFTDWEEFSKWTVDLFKVDNTKSKELTSFIDSLKSINDKETQILTAIKTAQEKIRYFSFVDGMSAYRPHNPSLVFGNKYGDCKDKSLLLSEILNAIGVESHPLLVSTDIGKVMDDRLPSPWNFDHTIVQFKYKDSVYYLDPTITSQGGSIEKIVTPPYYFGVVADKSQAGLTKIPFKKNLSVIRAKEDFEVPGIGGSARLKVETYYTGSEADDIRSSIKSKTKAETNKDYVDFYANEFPEIKIAKSVSFSDDTLNNALTVFEEYEVPNFWKYDSANSRYVADTYGRVISGYLVRPSTKARRGPFTIRSPLDVQLITNIHVPETWNVDNYSKKITGPSFNFNARWSYADKVIRLQFDLHNTENFVEPSKTVEYLDKIDEIYGELSFQIQHPGVSTPAQVSSDTRATDVRLGLLIVILSAGLFFGAKKIFAFDPRSRQLTERYDQIGGLLLLPAIGLTIWPLVAVYGITSEWASHRAIFADSPFGSGKVVLISNLLARLIFLALSALCAVLLWSRRTSTLHIAVACYALNIVIVVADVIVGKMLYSIEIGSAAQNRLFYAFLVPLVWVPYFLNSERVRGTFTQRLEVENE